MADGGGDVFQKFRVVTAGFPFDEYVIGDLVGGFPPLQYPDVAGAAFSVHVDQSKYTAVRHGSDGTGGNQCSGDSVLRMHAGV